jgi:amino acid permease
MYETSKLGIYHPRRTLKTKVSMQAQKQLKGDNEGVNEVSTFFNLVKAIVGAGSFALPWVCKNEGVLGGLITIVVAGILASYTMKQLVSCKDIIAARSSGSTIEGGVPAGLSYVDLASATFGEAGARFVFFCTVTASLGVCSAYIAFIGSTLESLAAQPSGLVHAMLTAGETAPWSRDAFQLAAAAFLLPIVCLRSFRFLSFTSALGTVAVAAAIAAVSAHVASEHGSVDAALAAAAALPLWPPSAAAYLRSFGSVAFLFCINFLVLPIER